LNFHQNLLESTDTPGPAGTPYWKVVTVQKNELVKAYSTCENCRLCAHNGLLPVKPRLYADSNYHSYVAPVMRTVHVRAAGETKPQLHQVPVPFAVRVVPFNHPRAVPLDFSGMPSGADNFSLGIGGGWPTQLDRLLKLVPDLKPGDSCSVEFNVGEAAGEEPAGWESNPNAAEWKPHTSAIIVYGRERLQESMDGSAWFSSPKRITTARQNLATIIHASRVVAGSLPDDEALWRIWEEVAGRDDNVEEYHARLS